MSYDLYFWKQTGDFEMVPEQVVDCLEKDKPLTGIASFPKTKVVEVFKSAFPEIVDYDAGGLDWDGEGSYFQVEFKYVTATDVTMIIVTCGYSLLKNETTMNRIIEACCSLGCALYDPQVGRRYAQREVNVQS